MALPGAPSTWQPPTTSNALEVYPKTVRLCHGKGFKLGLDFLYIPADDENASMVLAKVVHDGFPAAQSGAIKIGDVISCINSQPVTGDVDSVIEMCQCKGGRGTDEVIEVCHTSQHLPAPAPSTLRGTS